MQLNHPIWLNGRDLLVYNISWSDGTLSGLGVRERIGWSGSLSQIVLMPCNCWVHFVTDALIRVSGRPCVVVHVLHSCAHDALCIALHGTNHYHSISCRVKELTRGLLFISLQLFLLHGWVLIQDKALCWWRNQSQGRIEIALRLRTQPLKPLHQHQPKRTPLGIFAQSERWPCSDSEPPCRIRSPSKSSLDPIFWISARVDEGRVKPVWGCPAGVRVILWYLCGEMGEGCTACLAFELQPENVLPCHHDASIFVRSQVRVSNHPFLCVSACRQYWYHLDQCL